MRATCRAAGSMRSTSKLSRASTIIRRPDCGAAVCGAVPLPLTASDANPLAGAGAAVGAAAA